MRFGPWLLLVLAIKLCGTPSAAAEFVVAGDAYRRSEEPPIGGSPSTRLGEAVAPTDKALSWHFVRSAGARGEPGSSAILHTAELERSDPRLAGLMLRCGRQGIETIIVVVEPFPPHARPQITLRTLGQESKFVGTIIPTGAGIRLPSDPTALITGPWQTARELEIEVTNGGAVFKGVVALAGLPEALESLNAECVQK
jgi:hypothetical protein